jgi:catechol 2,3-dioxygenase-like lactoylglutathione lyase family enzyme
MPKQGSVALKLSSRAKRGICFFSTASLLALVAPRFHAAVQDVSCPKITGIAYVRLYAADLNKSREFYRSILGLGGDTTDCVSAGASCFSVNGRQSIGLAQITAGTPDNLLAEVAFSTPDVAGMQRYLTAHNVATKPVSKNAAGHPYLSLQDPEGHPIAFVEDSGEGFFTPKSEQVSTRLLHAGFIVKDHELEDRFYRGLLGFRMYWHGGFKDADTDWEELLVPDGSEWIEYMLNIPPNADHSERGIQNHFSLGVLQIKSAFNRLRSHGLKVQNDDKPEIGRDGKWSWDIYDPDVTRVEFMEFKPAQPPCCHPYEAGHPRP